MSATVHYSAALLIFLATSAWMWAISADINYAVPDTGVVAVDK
jgi:hypothetical protein